MNRVRQKTQDIHRALDLAVEVAKEAALSVIPERDRRVKADLGREVKIRGDIRLNRMLIDRLEAGSPYPVLSEEQGLSTGKSADKGYRWILDPLDGSLNFSRGIPLFCISIAFWKEMDPLLGIVYDFKRDEMFSGLVGEGAWLNGKAIEVSAVTEKNEAVLCTGFPVSTDFSESALLDFVSHIQLYRKVRLLGSAALSLAYVASGRADVYEENHIAIWDVAAGIALVIAAGGVVHFRHTNIENRLIVKAGNNLLLSSDLQGKAMGR